MNSKLANRIGYEMLVLLCRVMRHPSRRTEYLDGRAETRCPCGYINVSDRSFVTGPAA